MGEDIHILSFPMRHKKRHYGTLIKAYKPILSSAIHFVKPDDTITSIAIQYNTSLDDIKRLNNLWDDNDLFLRSQIKIPLNSTTTQLLPTGDEEAYSDDDYHRPSPTNFLTQSLSPSIERRLSPSSVKRTSADPPDRPKSGASRASAPAPSLGPENKAAAAKDFLSRFDLQLSNLKSSLRKMNAESE